MRIGIDMRMAGTGEGIGRYVEELVKNLARIDSQNEYLLLGREKFSIFPPKADPPLADNFQFPNFKLVGVKSKYYSWAEQTRLVGELKKLKLDLMHFPSFNAPIFYRGKFVVTIHDLIHHYFPGKKKSRFLHRLAYRLVIAQSVKKASRIIAVSESTKQDIVKSFGISSDKVEVVYEGVGEKFFESLPSSQIDSAKTRYNITKPYILFVGVWRQYKNLPRLASAFDILKERYGQDYQLVLAGKIDPFYPEIKTSVLSIKNSADIRALGFVPDEDLRGLYQDARAFILPSLTEGFGLIGVEAEVSGVPVIASNIPVLKEVLGNGAIYFDPNNENNMAEKINQVLTDEDLAKDLVTRGFTNAKKYDWLDTAKRTLEVYGSIIK